MPVGAVVFDLDGVLIDSEQVWDRARRDVVSTHGGHWTAGATTAMQGMSAPEWAQYVRDRLGVHLELDQINELVVNRLLADYQRQLPLLPGAIEAVSRLAARWPLGLASSSNRVIIDRVLAIAGLANEFAITVSSEEVARGKPAPDVYLEACRRLGEPPPRCVAVEDSTNGIRSAFSAQMKVAAIPNREFPPAPESLALATVVLDGLDQLTVEVVESLAP